MTPVKAFQESEAAQHHLVGGKGANLARLTQADFPVPPGFILTTEAYAQFIEHNDLENRIRAEVATLKYDDPDLLEAGTAAIRALVEKGQIPDALCAAIADEYTPLGDDVLVAVRSSGTAEDLADASFAGQHDTYLHIKSLDGVVDAIKRCWASLWTARATSYRQARGIDHLSVAIAVVIQKMVDSEVSGVMFTANPSTTATDEIVINASWGLGEAIVAGIVTPDEYTVKYNTLRVTEKILGSKKVRVIRDPEAESGTVTDEVPDGDQSRFTLTDSQVAQLADLGRRVQDYYGGFPQDIEWGLADGQFYLLQSRPITGVEFTWDEELDYWHVLPEDDTVIWSRSMSDEVWHGAITPLFYTTRGKMLHDAHAATHKMWGLKSQNYRYYKPWKAGSYYNTKVEASDVTHMCPPQMRFMVQQHIAPPDREDVLNAPFNWTEFFQRIYRNRTLFPEYGFYGWLKMLKKYVYESREEAAGLTDEELRLLADAELIRYTKERVAYEHKYIVDVWNGFFFNMRIMLLTLMYFVQEWYDGDNATVATDLLTGTEQRSATVIENSTLWNLAKDIRHSDTLRALFDKHQNAEFFAELQSHEEGRLWLDKYKKFLDVSGHRGHADRDFYFPRRAEDPSIDYQAFTSFMTVDESHDPDLLEEESNKRREAAYADVLANLSRKPLGFARVEAFKQVYSYVQTMAWLRDDHRDFVDIATFTYKRCFLEINRRLMDRGVFNTDRDFWFLTERDVYSLLEGAPLTPLMRAKIDARMEAFDRADRREVDRPMHMVKNKPVSFEEIDDSDPNVLRGIGTSKGVATGTARIIKELKHIGRVQQGDILIVFATDPGWTPVFLVISGLVLETGGLLSHGASISREYGIPAVQLPGALNRIPDGARISIDGSTGVITLLDEEGHGPEVDAPVSTPHIDPEPFE